MTLPRDSARQRRDGRPHVREGDEDNGSYTDNSEGSIAHTANHNWRHDFQEIVGSLLEAGLSVEALRESPYAEWRALPFLVETECGWTMPEGMPKIPLSFAVVARKPPQGEGSDVDAPRTEQERR